MTEYHVIKISTRPKVSWRVFVGPALQLLIIGIGIAADSAAMQWSGFVILILSMFAFGMLIAKKDENLTISDARKRLDEIERREGRE